MGFFTVTSKIDLSVPPAEQDGRVHQTMLIINADTIYPQSPRDYIAALLQSGTAHTPTTQKGMIKSGHANMLWSTTTRGTAIPAQIHDEVFAQPSFAELLCNTTPDNGVAFTSMMSMRDLARIRGRLAVSVAHRTYAGTHLNGMIKDCVKTLNDTLADCEPDTTVFYKCVIEAP